MTLAPTNSRFTQSAADALYLEKSLADAKGDLLAATAADTFARRAVGADGTVLRALASEASGLEWAAAAGLLTELFDSTLVGDAASIDTGAGGFLTSLDHLLVLMYLRTTEAIVTSSGLLTFNNDGGANYDRQVIRNTNTTLAGVITLAGTSIALPALGANAQAGAFAPITMWIPSYAQTTGHKGLTWSAGVLEDTAADCRTEQSSGRWRSTVAISRIIVAAGSGNLLAGSRVTVYGIG
jgi:hypothetical protein